MYPEVQHSRSYHNFVQNWHPCASKFERSVSVIRAEEAIREGDELRRKLEGRRILEAA